MKNEDERKRCGKCWRKILKEMRGIGMRAQWNLGLRKRDMGAGGVSSDYCWILSEKRKQSQHVTRSLQEGRDGCHCCVQHHASIPGGTKGEEKWKKRDIFPRNPPAAFCLDLIGQNWITWLPLAAREAGKSGPGFSRPVERSAHCLIKCSQSSAKRRKGACLLCTPMPVPRSAVPCPPGVCASLKNAEAATMPVWSLQVFYIIGH